MSTNDHHSRVVHNSYKQQIKPGPLHPQTVIMTWLDGTTSQPGLESGDAIRRKFPKKRKIYNAPKNSPNLMSPGCSLVTSTIDGWCAKGKKKAIAAIE